MDPQAYPRPDLSSGPYAKDKTWGIVIMVLSSLGICCGLGIAGLGGVVGIAGGAAVASAAPGDRSAAAGLGIGGGVLALLGFGILAASAVQIVGGFGVMSSRRWGFTLTLILSGLSVLMHLPSVVHGTGIVGVALNGVSAWYCWSRLSGKEGPTPV